MDNEDAKQDSSGSHVDWKGLGYISSILSVLLLGAVAWPKSGEPAWHLWVLIAGIVTSIVGMAMRYKAHLAQQRKMRRVEGEAQRKN